MARTFALVSVVLAGVESIATSRIAHEPKTTRSVVEASKVDLCLRLQVYASASKNVNASASVDGGVQHVTKG